MPIFPKYESYKDSEVAWLEDVPEHWKVLPGRAYLKPKKVKNTGNQIDTVLSLSYGKIIIKPEEKLHGLVPESFETYQIVEPGDIIVRATDLQNDQTSLRIGLVEDKGIITSAYLCLQPSEAMDSRFAYYILHSYDLLKVYYGMGSGLRQNLDYTDFKYLPLAIPSIEEQKRIVEFLDRKTSEIDQAIAQKQRLIELLQEQKAILINQAVTKGLNPNTPMRDSGIEWLGDIPKHWELKPFKRITSRIDVGIAEAATHAYTDQGVPIIRSGNVRTNYMDTREILYIKEWFAEKNRSKYLSSGDILTVRTGANAGMTAVVPEELNHSQCFTLLVATPKANQVSQFYSYYINTPMIQSVFSVEGWGAAQVNLSVPIMKELPIVEPPFQEQKQIVTYLNAALEEFGSATNTVKKQISLLQEYKQNLISEVVTGKLKV